MVGANQQLKIRFSSRLLAGDYEVATHGHQKRRTQ